MTDTTFGAVPIGSTRKHPNPWGLLLISVLLASLLPFATMLLAARAMTGWFYTDWRLREPFQHGYVRRKSCFVFDR